MAKQVFRQKSLEELSSVEESHDYLHAPNPRLWMLLSVALALTVGFAAYVGAIRQANTIETDALVESVTDDDGNSGTAIQVTIPKAVESIVRVGMPVMIGPYPGTIESVFTDRDYGAWAIVFTDEEIPPDGTYEASIILEGIPLFGFLFG